MLIGFLPPWIDCFYLHVLKRYYSVMTTRRGAVIHSAHAKSWKHTQRQNNLLTHSETEVHTCSEGVCVTAFAWVETNNLHSHYTCFYVQEFSKRCIALGKTFFSCFSFPSQFCEMDTGKLSPHTSRPASSSAFLLILCILIRPTAAFAVVNSAHGFGAMQ